VSHTAAEHTAAGAEHTVTGRTEFENTAAAESKFVATEHTAVEHSVAAHTAAAGSADIDSVGTDPAGTDPADTDSADTEIDNIAADCTHQIADLHKIARFEKNFQHYKNYCSRY